MTNEIEFGLTVFKSDRVRKIVVPDWKSFLKCYITIMKDTASDTPKEELVGLTTFAFNWKEDDYAYIKKENCVRTNLLHVDIDNLPPDSNFMEWFVDNFQLFNYMIVESPSSRKNKGESYRIYFPLSKVVDPATYEQNYEENLINLFPEKYWNKINGKKIEHNGKSSGIDLQNKNCNRFMYIPNTDHRKTVKYTVDRQYLSFEKYDRKRVPTPTPTISSNVEIDVEITKQNAVKYLEKCDPAVSGKGGSTVAFFVCMKLVNDFGLSKEDALDLFKNNYNSKCLPPWSDAEIDHKLNDSMKKIDSNYQSKATKILPPTLTFEPNFGAGRIYVFRNCFQFKELLKMDGWFYFKEDPSWRTQDKSKIVPFMEYFKN